jgi:hypothetical protein
LEKTRTARTGPSASLRELVAQVFSERELIDPGTYAAYNIFVGLILVGAAVLVLVEPRVGPIALAVALGIAGLTMVAALPVAYLLPRATIGLLCAHGVLFILLALSLAGESIRWALLAPPLSSFRYLPGLIVAALTYGGLQVAVFGPRWANARRIRVASLTIGVLAELAVALALIVRFSK